MTNVNEGISEEGEPSVLDGKPLVEDVPGGRRVTMCIMRPEVESLKSFRDKKEDIQRHEEFRARMAQDHPERAVSYSSYKRAGYDVDRLLGDFGGPQSVERVEGAPQVVVVHVRHLAHEGDVAGAEDREKFRGRAETLVDELHLDDGETMVCVMASSASSFVAEEGGIRRNSRTESTLDVIRDVLRERGVRFIDGGLSPQDTIAEGGSTSLRFRSSLDEFPVADTMTMREAARRAAANKKAASEGAPLPYPDDPSKPPTPYASLTSDLELVEEKTGISEVGSATVARGLRGLDALAEYYLDGDGMPSGIQRVVVIAGRHGQFNSGILGSFTDITRRGFPLIFAGNGSYFTTTIERDQDGRVVETYTVETGDKTGMEER